MFVPVTLMPGEKKTIRIYTAWYVPNSTLRLGEEPEDWNDNNVDSARLAVEKADKGNYKPWYSSRFTGVNEVIDYFLSHYKILRNQTERFTDSFYRSTLPPEVIEAVSANLSILKSPTVMRQYDAYGLGRDVPIIGDRVMAHVLTSGIMHRLFHTYFLLWNVR